MWPRWFATSPTNVTIITLWALLHFACKCNICYRRMIFSLSAEPSTFKSTYSFNPFASMLDNERLITFVGVTSYMLAHRCNTFLSAVFRPIMSSLSAGPGIYKPTYILNLLMKKLLYLWPQ